MAKGKFNLDRSDIIAIMALVVSLGAMFVSVLQTNILKEQQQIMAGQQDIMASQLEGSVWPYLKTKISLVQEESEDTGETLTSITYTLKNKGVGPAKITSFNLMIGDSSITSFVDFFDYLREAIGEENMKGVTFSLPNGSVLAAGEVHAIYTLKYPADLEVDKSLVASIGKTKLCYCSIYDKCYGACEEEVPSDSSK
ncbi:MAG: hypothetical protein AAFY71_21530 [Bacteroidota bacterium]